MKILSRDERKGEKLLNVDAGNVLEGVSQKGGRWTDTKGIQGSSQHPRAEGKIPGPSTDNEGTQ